LSSRLVSCSKYGRRNLEETGLKVKVARTAGFCMGVRKALDLVFDAVRAAPGERGRLSTLGPLIHNHQALEALEALGVRKAEDLSEVEC